MIFTVQKKKSVRTLEITTGELDYMIRNVEGELSKNIADFMKEFFETEKKAVKTTTAEEDIKAHLSKKHNHVCSDDKGNYTTMAECKLKNDNG